jgi:hypothetical protein
MKRHRANPSALDAVRHARNDLARAQQSWLLRFFNFTAALLLDSVAVFTTDDAQVTIVTSLSYRNAIHIA